MSFEEIKFLVLTNKDFYPNILNIPKFRTENCTFYEQQTVIYKKDARSKNLAKILFVKHK